MCFHPKPQTCISAAQRRFSTGHFGRQYKIVGNLSISIPIAELCEWCYQPVRVRNPTVILVSSLVLTPGILSLLTPKCIWNMCSFLDLLSHTPVPEHLTCLNPWVTFMIAFLPLPLFPPIRSWGLTGLRERKHSSAQSERKEGGLCDGAQSPGMEERRPKVWFWL